jgi:hypothetical protein
MKPQVLHGTREEYEVFDLTVFRKHFRQEVQNRKFWVYIMAEKKEKKIGIGPETKHTLVVLLLF